MTETPEVTPSCSSSTVVAQLDLTAISWLRNLPALVLRVKEHHPSLERSAPQSTSSKAASQKFGQSATKAQHAKHDTPHPTPSHIPSAASHPFQRFFVPQDADCRKAFRGEAICAQVTQNKRNQSQRPPVKSVNITMWRSPSAPGSCWAALPQNTLSVHDGQ
ncbi:hypothetical protein EJ06DRAFT_343339 [Trichodelitschia bisporula]|uniref:Uncharacterized protein n=1 Tax=Trichodelitschia bisporula TaxID=703511 RepID=A0A6G1I314_9PEZI|nr:hypothetical protein EJ06DRAFT_343339 [Trichodelitschia bisporula]